MPSPGDAPQPESDPRMDLSPAAATFAEFVQRHEAGEAVAIDAFCAAHPEIAVKLRRLHKRWAKVAAVWERDLPSLDPVSQALTAPLQDGGQRARRYTVGDEVARGGMSIIVRARDHDLQRTVAMKILPSRISTPMLLRRFLAEAKVTGRLQHPCIVPVHDIALDERGRVFFTMPLIEGRDLSVIFPLVFAGEDGWTLARGVAVLQRVCEAVAYAHSCGVLHRDLKPTNIMVGNFGETYVMDWGLARVLGEPGDAAQLGDAAQAGEPQPGPAAPASAVQTRVGDIIGTPVYMAPEQAGGEVDSVGERTDVYAIGAMLYHLLAGAMPYVAAGETPSGDDVVARIRQGPPPPIADRAARLPAELVAICERAMARDPAARYPGMQALADDLRAFLEVRVVAAHGTGRLAVLRQWIRRNRGLAAAITTTMVALAVGFAVSTSLFLDARANQQRADVELAASKFERARTLVRLGDMNFAGKELWPQHIAGDTPRATHWALWETYANNPCLASIPRAPASAGRQYIVALGAGEVLAMGGPGPQLRFVHGTTLRLIEEAACATPIGGLDLSPDGTRLAIGTATGVELWDAARRRPVGRLDLPGEAALRHHAVRFARDGVHLAAVSPSCLRLWRLDRLDQGALVLEHAGRYDTGLAFDPSSRWLVAGRGDGVIDLFDVAERGRVRELVGHREAVPSACFAGDPAVLVTGSVDRTLRTWSVADGRCLATVAGANGSIRDLLSVQRDGSVLACGWTRVDRWQPATMARVRFATRGGTVMCADRSERLLWQVTGTELCLWELAPPADRLRLGGHSNRVVSGVDPAGRFVATGDGDGILRIFAIPDGGLLQQFADHTKRMLWLRLDAASGTLISVSDDAVSVRDTTTWATIDASFLGRHVRCAQMDGRGRIASGTTSGTVRVHEVATGRLVHEWVVHQGQEVLGVAFSPDGQRLAISSRGATQRLALRTLATGASITLHAEPVWEPVFSPDGRRLAVGSFARAVLLFDGVTGALQSTLPGHTGSVWALAFHPRDPDLLVSGGNDGVVCFWDLASERQCARFEMFDGDVGSVSFADDGNWLAVSGLGEDVEVWDTTYYDRHIAGNLASRLDEARERGTVSEARAAALTRWADETLARPWPRLAR